MFYLYNIKSEGKRKEETLKKAELLKNTKYSIVGLSAIIRRLLFLTKLIFIHNKIIETNL